MRPTRKLRLLEHKGLLVSLSSRFCVDRFEFSTISGACSALQACPPAKTRIYWPLRSSRRICWTLLRRPPAPRGCRGCDVFPHSKVSLHWFFLSGFLLGPFFDSTGCDSWTQSLGREITIASMM